MSSIAYTRGTIFNPIIYRWWRNTAAFSDGVLESASQIGPKIHIPPLMFIKQHSAVYGTYTIENSAIINKPMSRANCKSPVTVELARFVWATDTSTIILVWKYFHRTSNNNNNKRLKWLRRIPTRMVMIRLSQNLRSGMFLSLIKVLCEVKLFRV